MTLRRFELLMPDRKSGGLTACLKGRDKGLAINVVQEPGRFLLYKEISIGSNIMAGHEGLEPSTF